MTDVLLNTAVINDTDGADLPDVTWGDGSAARPHELVLATAPRTAGRQVFLVHFRGALLLASTSPEMEACRRLQTGGYAGHLQTRWAGAAHAAMRLTIEAGALQTVTDADAGLRIIKWRPFQDPTAVDAADG